jgi:hypothetical protein
MKCDRRFLGVSETRRRFGLVLRVVRGGFRDCASLRAE